MPEKNEGGKASLSSWEEGCSSTEPHPWVDGLRSRERSRKRSLNGSQLKGEERVEGRPDMRSRDAVDAEEKNLRRLHSKEQSEPTGEQTGRLRRGPSMSGR